MLQPYSARGQIRTIITQYRALGEERRAAMRRIRQNRAMYMIAYNYVGREIWEDNSWKADKGLRLLARNLRRLTDEESALREEIAILESDALDCFMLIAKIMPEFLERGQGTRADVLQGGRQGFSFEG